MDFSFTEEQQMLRDSVSRFLQKNYDFDARQALVQSDQPWSDDVWRQFAELGLLALPFAEDAGGLGGSVADVVAIAEPFGEHLLVEPYMSSILLAGGAIAASDNAGARERLAGLMDGSATAAFAHEEGKGTADPALVTFEARETDGGHILTGEKRMVLGGAEADMLVVSARTGGKPGDKEGLALFFVDPKQDGISITPFQTIDGRSAAHIKFDGVLVDDDSLIAEEAYVMISAVIADAMIALCAEAVGAMGALLKDTSGYAATRKQFGVAIGSFQAVAHRLADMKIAYTKAHATLLYTTALAEAGEASPRDISFLKAQAGKLGRAIGEAAIQTHGGVGMTDELSVGHYHKRLLAIDKLFGDCEYHQRMIGKG